MARTKQTARACFVQQVPRAQLVAQKRARNSQHIKKQKKNKKLGASNQSDESESESIADEDLHEVNNQQFSIRFDDQAKCEENAVIDNIINCTNCEAILTSSSKTYSKDEYKKLAEDPALSDEKKQKFLKNYDNAWICEFCLAHNAIPKSYKAPSIENPCFLIESAIEKRPKRGKKEETEDINKILIFCIDISGSMEQEVHGRKSRLDVVKEALIDEVNRMNFEKESIQVGLVTFGSQVTLIGDGKNFQPIILGSEIYHNFDKIVKEAEKVKNFAEPIVKSHKVLKERIQNLGVYGSTALGPGLLASIEIASKGSIGSKVIICTDGEANVGVGSSMMSFYAQNGKIKNDNFYEKAAEFAKNKRVQVSILSLKGDRCNLKELGKLSLATGGSILKIEPKHLGTEFSKIAKEEILGTDSNLIIKVNKVFEIISHIPNELSADKTTLTQQFGNFSDQTELTFEFKVLTKEEAALKPGVDMELFNQPQLPMQVQLTYVGRNGNKYKQVITDWRVPTENEKEIYEGANFGLFAASVLQRASAKIRSQEFVEAEKIVKGYHSIVAETFSKTESAEELKRFGDRIKNLETILNSKLRKSRGEKKDRSRSRERKKSKRSVPQSRGRGRGGLNGRNRSRSASGSESESERSMSSDEEEQILYKEMRARSRSNSPEEKKENSKSKRR